MDVRVQWKSNSQIYQTATGKLQEQQGLHQVSGVEYTMPSMGQCASASLNQASKTQKRELKAWMASKVAREKTNHTHTPPLQTLSIFVKVAHGPKPVFITPLFDAGYCQTLSNHMCGVHEVASCIACFTLSHGKWCRLAWVQLL